MSKLFCILGINRKIMASKKYYIYEIPGVKIGCTDNVKRRVKEQKCTQYKILEHHTDVMEASRREIELQKQYGYKVDKTPYYKTLLIQTTEGRSKAGRKNKESGHMAALCEKYSKIQGKKHKESGHMASLGKLKRKLTFDQAEEIREKFTKMDGGKVERYDTLAAEYNVSNTGIRYIIKNQTYTEQ
jgi:hypothetical protein